MLGKGFRQALRARAQAYGLSRLSEDSDVSRQALYAFFDGGDMKLSNLESLMDVLGVELSFKAPDPVDEDVLGNLGRFGSPLVAGKPKTPMTLEASLAKALRLVGGEGRLTSVLPYLLVHKAQTVDGKELLKHLEGDSKSLQFLGYFLDVALAYRKRKPLEKLRKSVEKKLKQKSDLMLRERDQGKSLKDFERFDNPAAKKWRVGTRDELSYLVERCRKWEKLEQTA